MKDSVVIGDRLVDFVPCALDTVIDAALVDMIDGSVGEGGIIYEEIGGDWGDEANSVSLDPGDEASLASLDWPQYENSTLLNTITGPTTGPNYSYWPFCDPGEECVWRMQPPPTHS